MGDPEEIYQSSLNYLKHVKNSLSGNATFDMEPAITLMGRILDEPELIQKILPLTMQINQEYEYNILHQVNSMVYALKIGMGLEYSRLELLELSLSALMHDVGMFMMPENIMRKPEQLTESELEVIRSHAEIGKDIVSSMKAEYPWLPEVIHQHHEKGNGQGYPRGLNGEEIHEYAKIVCLVDCYEAMIHDRPHRKALMQSFSAKELVNQSKDCLYPSYIIKAFLEEITPYPAGSFVMLNSKVICEVVCTYPQYPLRPELKILFDSEGNKTHSGRVIKLKEYPHLYIMDCVSAKE